MDDDDDGGDGSPESSFSAVMDISSPCPELTTHQLVGLQVQFLDNAIGGLDVCQYVNSPISCSSPDDSTPEPQDGVGMNINDMSGTTLPPRHRVYQDETVGPWVVYFRPKANGKRLNVVSIARDLMRAYPTVTEIQKVSPNKMRVVVPDRKVANAIVCSERFTIEYRVYIPARDVEIDGVVTEEGLSRDDLMADGVGRFKDPGLPPVKILDAFQMRSVSGEGDNKKFSPSNSFRVTFAGTALPDYVTISKVRLPVRLYVPRIMNCHNCNKLGHTAAYCCNQACCSKCGEKHEESTCKTGAEKCLHCGGSPHALLACPKYISRRNNTKRLLQTKSKKSYAEILQRSLPPVPENRFALLSNSESEDDDNPLEGTSSAILTLRESNPACPKRRRKNPAKGVETPLSAGRKPTASKSRPPVFEFSLKDCSREFPALPELIKTPFTQSSSASANPSRRISAGNQKSSTSSRPSHTILGGMQKVPSSGIPMVSTSESADSPTATEVGKFKLSDLLEMVLDFFGVSDTWRRMVRAFLPIISATLKQKSSSCPLLAEIISFDG